MTKTLTVLVISRSSATTRGAGAADTVTKKTFLVRFYKKERVYFLRTYCRSTKRSRKFGIACLVREYARVGK